MPKPGRPPATRAAAFTASRLKAAILSRGAPASSAIASSCGAMVDREGEAAFPAASRRVVAQWTWFSVSSRRSARCGLPLLEEGLQLRPGRIFRRAEQPRHCECAAGIRPGGRRCVRLAPQPAAQEAAHEGVAGAEHVEDLDRKPPPDDAVVDALRDLAGEHDAAHRPAFQHDRRARERPDAAKGLQSVSSSPAAMWISSSVPTIRSQSGRTACKML